jgi:hypothetical protein
MKDECDPKSRKGWENLVYTFTPNILMFTVINEVLDKIIFDSVQRGMRIMISVQVINYCLQ